MNTDELRRLLEYICTPYQATYAVLACDELHLITPRKFPLVIICNTERKFKAGKHWVAFFMRRRPDPIEYFDSYSQDMRVYNKYFLDFARRMSQNIIRMPYSLQCLDSEFCGQYCITYLYYRLKNVSINYIYSSIFTHKCRQNDEFVAKLVKQMKHSIRKCKSERKIFFY